MKVYKVPFLAFVCKILSNRNDSVNSFFGMLLFWILLGEIFQVRLLEKSVTKEGFPGFPEFLI